MHLRVQVSLSKARLTWDGVQCILRNINIWEVIRAESLAEMSANSRRRHHPLVVIKCHIDKCLLIGEPVELFHLFSLKFVLDSLAVRSVTD